MSPWTLYPLPENCSLSSPFDLLGANKPLQKSVRWSKGPVTGTLLPCLLPPSLICNESAGSSQRWDQAGGDLCDLHSGGSFLEPSWQWGLWNWTGGIAGLSLSPLPPTSCPSSPILFFTFWLCCLLTVAAEGSVSCLEQIEKISSPPLSHLHPWPEWHVQSSTLIKTQQGLRKGSLQSLLPSYPPTTSPTLKSNFTCLCCSQLPPQLLWAISDSLSLTFAHSVHRQCSSSWFQLCPLLIACMHPSLHWVTP